MERGSNSGCHQPTTYIPFFWTGTAKTPFSGRGTNSPALFLALPLRGLGRISLSKPDPEPIVEGFLLLATGLEEGLSPGDSASWPELA